MPRTGPISRKAAEATPTEAAVAWRRRKDFRQPEILAAARTLIEEEGASGVSMARIAKAAGVSEATVYKYFVSKQDLIGRVMQDWATPFIERLSAELAHVTGLRARLVLIAIRFLRSMEETPKLHRVFFQDLRWSNYRGTQLHRLNQLFAANVIATVEAGMRSGEIAADVDARMFRDMLFGGLEHIGMRTSFAGRTIDVETHAARYVDLMLRGVLTRREPTSLSTQVQRFATLLDRLETRLD